MELNQYICANQERISPNLKACCEKPILERTPCMYALPKDQVPEDLPKDINEFIDEHACKRFADEKDDCLARFVYEFARRHPDLSSLTLMRVSKGYEGVLTKCCAEANPVECLKSAPQLLEAGIKEAQDESKKSCEAYEKHGDFGYNIGLVYYYAQKIPQLPDVTLLEITGKMTDVAGKCCALPESQRFACAEEKLDLILGKICEKQANTFVSEQVRKCCTETYVGRKTCFAQLKPDQSHEKPKFDDNALQVDADICKGTEEEQKNKRLTLLTRFLRLKPDMTREQMLGCVGDFGKVREKCCAETDHQECFARERPGFILQLKTRLGLGLGVGGIGLSLESK